MKKDVKPAEKPAQTAAGSKWSQLSDSVF